MRMTKNQFRRHLGQWNSFTKEFIGIVKRCDFEGAEEERDCLLRCIDKTLKRFRKLKKEVIK